VLPGTYEPRAATETVLRQVVRTHLDRFLAETGPATDGAGLPRFIAREFRDFLGCGQLERGFARVRCDTCRFERLVPFSCKARAICPSCGGRRMAEQAGTPSARHRARHRRIVLVVHPKRLKSGQRHAVADLATAALALVKNS
jgi:ribosomal protein S27E